MPENNNANVNTETPEIKAPEIKAPGFFTRHRSKFLALGLIVVSATAGYLLNDIYGDHTPANTTASPEA